MPTGFDTPSGAHLPERLVPIAQRLGDYLRRCRGAGTITPENPKTAADLSRLIGEIGHKAEGPEIRAMVNYLRMHRHPIASTARGYFWATRREELNSTLIHMMDRIAAIQHAITGLENSFPVDGQRELI